MDFLKGNKNECEFDDKKWMDLAILDGKKRFSTYWIKYDRRQV